MHRNISLSGGILVFMSLCLGWVLSLPTRAWGRPTRGTLMLDMLSDIISNGHNNETLFLGGPFLKFKLWGPLSHRREHTWHILNSSVAGVVFADLQKDLKSVLLKLLDQCTLESILEISKILVYKGGVSPLCSATACAFLFFYCVHMKSSTKRSWWKLSGTPKVKGWSDHWPRPPGHNNPAMASHTNMHPWIYE